MEPVRRPHTAWQPKKVPHKMGERMTNMAGAIISDKEASVEI